MYSNERNMQEVICYQDTTSCWLEKNIEVLRIHKGKVWGRKLSRVVVCTWSSSIVTVISYNSCFIYNVAPIVIRNTNLSFIIRILKVPCFFRIRHSSNAALFVFGILRKRHFSYSAFFKCSTLRIRHSAEPGTCNCIL